MEYYSAIKGNELLIQTETEVNLKITELGNRIQATDSTCCGISLAEVSRKCKLIRGNRKQTKVVGGDWDWRERVRLQRT